MLAPGEEKLIAPVALEPILKRTIAWSEVNSGTGNLEGLNTMADNLAVAFAALPGEIKRVAPAPVTRVGADGGCESVDNGSHLVACIRPEAQRRILLTGHMDTVFPSNHSFQHCAPVVDGILRGPGTADMKGGLALMLEGLLAFERTEPALGYDILINSDEESGSLSSSSLLAALSAGKLAALTYEPALPNGSMARGRPGSGNFSLIVKGRSAHAGRNPNDGRNAVVAAAELAAFLSKNQTDTCKVNVARIDGGSANNVVPDLAILRFNIRPASPEAQRAAAIMLDEAIAALAKTNEVDTDLQGSFGRPPKPISQLTESLFELVRQASGDLGTEMIWENTGGVCDGNNIASHGVPVLDTMGALGGQIHSSEEFLRIDDLVGRARLTALVLHRLDGQGLFP